MSATITQDERWLTRQEVCARLRIAPRTLTAWAADGRLPAVRFTRKVVRWDAREVERFEREAIRRQVAESRAKQGLPPTVEDAGVLDRIAALVVGTEAEVGQ
jgi:excisionase family DNA binding protein